MLSDYVRQRIAQLQRQAHRQGSLPAGEPNSPLASAARELPAGAAVRNRLGEHWLVERRIAELWPAGQTLIDTWLRRQGTPADQPDADRADREQAAFRQHFPREIVLIDLETCGLAGSMVFLVGLLHDGPKGLTLTQLFARDYSEEPAALVTLWEILAGKRVLVTFNGKSFDWPMLRDRTTYHRLERELCDLTPVRDSMQAERAHFDLLHHARRRYATELPDCRLATLEQHVCQRRRVGDIAGSDIPAAYHDFVRSGDATDMHSVLHHNALDLVTLLEMALKITSPGDAG